MENNRPRTSFSISFFQHRVVGLIVQVTIVFLLFSCVNASNLPVLTDLSSFPSSSAGVLFLGEEQSLTGLTVGPGGDFNGDGLQDFVITSPDTSPYGRYRAGEVFVIFGSASLPSSINLTEFSASQGVRIVGANASDSEPSLVPQVGSAGDFNKDGFGDIMIGFGYGSPYGRSNAGYSVIIFGGKTVSGTIDLLTLTPSQGILIIGEIDGAGTGTVSGVGDVNGDGYLDVAIGAQGLGAAYLLFGSASFPPVIDLAFCTTSFTSSCILIMGEPGDFADSISAAGDINGDGISDFMIGSPGAYSSFGEYGAGLLFVFYGRKTFPQVIDLTTTVNFGGVIIQGTCLDLLSLEMSPAGDMNKDGFDDILVTQLNAGTSSPENATLMYLIYGGKNLPLISNITSHPSSVAFLGPISYMINTPVSGNYDINQDGEYFLFNKNII